MQFAPDLLISNYRLERQLGTGASGEVWRATYEDRKVAIKFMNVNLLTSEENAKHQRRFSSEIQALECLIDCAHVPSLLGYDLHYERPYLVMEYVSSPPYDQLIASGEMMFLTIGERLNLLYKIAETIAFIHEKDIIHRDIKPANINGLEHPYVLDFSIAIKQSEAHRAEPNVGTAFYMPPPDGHKPDILGDNYAFALVAYEVIFGQHPIFSMTDTGQTLEFTRELARQRMRDGTWKMPSKLQDVDLPRSLLGADLKRLDAIFETALGERKFRYKNLVAFVNDIEQAIFVPENSPYLDYRPQLVTSSLGALVPGEEHYTLNEVHRSQRNTDIFGAQRRKRSARNRWLYVGITILSVIALFSLGMAMLQNAG